MPYNPYSAPESSNNELNLLSQQPLWARQIVKAWEKRRIIFNIVLLIPGILILLKMRAPFTASIGIAFFVGVMANLCYFLGPLTELYACAITSKSELPSLRKLLFGFGLAGSLLLFLFIFTEVY